MTRRAVLLARPATVVPPPGVDPGRYAAALLADTFELLDDLELLTATVAAVPPSAVEQVAAATGVPVRGLDPDRPELAALDALAAEGAAEGAVVAGDAPDLPGLLVGKLFSALSAAAVAVCPAEGGGLVALAARLPVADWLRGLAVGLDTAEAVALLRAAAPPRSFVVGPGWHRLRAAADVARLDPGLEGWPLTRAVLAGRRTEGL